MKIIHLFAALPLTFIISCSEVEQDHTPESVLESFGTMYPNAKEVEWEHEEDTWEAEFMSNDHEVSAEYSETGGWIETETTLHRSEVPATVVEGIFAKYTNAEFLKFEEVRGEDFLAYEVDIMFEEEEIEILISGSGIILEGEENAEEEEGEVIPADEEQV
jgi:hypothetical protein